MQNSTSWKQRLPCRPNKSKEFRFRVAEPFDIISSLTRRRKELLMKTKKSLLVVPAIALVFTLVFTTCSNGGGGGGGNQAGYDGTPGLAFELIDGSTGRATLNGKEYRVRKGDVKNGHVKIPAYYNGSPVTEIGASWDNEGFNAFGGTGITSIEIPNTVTKIGAWSFSGCDNITGITIPASVTEIGDAPFNGCYNLKNITVAADNPNYSSEGGILYNKNKTELVAYPSVSGDFTIPESVTTIGPFALFQCNLTSVIIHSNVTYIGGYNNKDWHFVGGAFFNCWNLTSITVAPGNPNYSSQDGILYNKAKTELLQAPGAISGNLTIPSSVTSIVDSAFWRCNHLTSVTIPASVMYIGNGAFLTSATITLMPNSQLKTIGELAFANCENFTSIIIPASVTKIGPGAFYWWTSSQTINVHGHANQAAADTAWGQSWRKQPEGYGAQEYILDIAATIKYWNGSSYQ